MPLEDHILSTVRTLKSAGESLLDLAKKVGEEIVKDKPAPAAPEGATAKPDSEYDIENFQNGGIFRFGGNMYRKCFSEARLPMVVADGKLHVDVYRCETVGLPLTETVYFLKGTRVSAVI